jgi:SPP1 gp7 family putative phage head morphogenesis protein
MSSATDFARAQALTPKEAVDYLQQRGLLTETFSWQDLWHDEHAQQFTVSRLARLDLLKAIQDGITKSVQGDLTRRDWTKNARELLQSAGWWGDIDVLDPVTGKVLTTRFDAARLKLIYDTNTRMAYSAGLWERIWRNRETHPYARYITMGDARVREQHRAWHGLVLPVDHPFWEAHWPPNGWRCRCYVTGVSQREYDKGYSEYRAPYEYNPDGTVKHIPDIERIPFKKTAPAESLIEWTNKRTGEVSMVPEGVTPGFDYNPGLSRARLEMLQRSGTDKLDNLPAPIRDAAITPMVSEETGRDFAKEVTAAHAALPAATRQALAGAGYEIRIVDKVVSAAPDLAGAAGQMVEQIDGLTRYAQRQILIAEQALDLANQTWKAAMPGRGAAVLQHEVGHALDEIHRLAAIPEVAAAWLKEAAPVAVYRDSVDADFAREIDYFTKEWPRGLLETIAELYALRHGAGTASFLNVAAAFPETLAALYQALDDKGL